MAHKELVACIKTGDKYGDEYVTRLRDGVARHLKTPHRFVCYTDKPVSGVDCETPLCGYPGWWSKIGLFRLGHALYFDLDVVITGDLAPLLEINRFTIIKDYWQHGFNSSVMRICGDTEHLWRQFRPELMAHLHGDQDYITAMKPDASTFPADWFPSFKANDCANAAPDGAKAVIFHGHPKPHECGGWVAEQWQ